MMGASFLCSCFSFVNSGAEYGIIVFVGLSFMTAAAIQDYIEKQIQLYEQEYEQEMQEREEEIVEYVMKLSKAELRQMLIQRMIDDLYY